MCFKEDKRREENDRRQGAARIERDHPNWIVHFGVYTREYVAFPRFETPEPVRLKSRDPGKFAALIRDAERYLGISARPYTK